MNKGGALYYFGDPEPGRAFKQQGNGINQAVTRKAGFPGDTQRNEATELATLQAFSNNMSGDTWLEAAASVSSKARLGRFRLGKALLGGLSSKGCGLVPYLLLALPTHFSLPDTIPRGGLQ